MATLVQTEEEPPLPVGDPPAQLGRWIAEGLAEIKAYVESAPFQRMLAELRRVPPGSRDLYVRTVLLNRDELARRGLEPPDGLTVQRSEFHDQRPTVFCVSKPLPRECTVWRRVTYTFDEGAANGNDAGDG